MNYQDLRIIFMGTPEFAVASLHALIQEGCKVVGVVTAPDKPAGRGMKLQQSAVKKYAEEHQLTVLQPAKLKDPLFLQSLRALQPDIQVVVAFRMLPETVWSFPPMGTINVHGSLLPKYRGAAPINWAIIQGEKETGVTTFRLQHEIDTGNILLQECITIGDNQTAGEVHDIMKEVGAKLLIRTIKGLAEGSLKEISQDSLADNETLKKYHAPKIFTETCKINWNNSTAAVHNLIRGLSPFPGAFTELNGKILKVYRSEKIIEKHTLPPGQLLSDQKHFLRFATTDGFIDVRELQLEGKKRMGVEDFLRGNRIEVHSS